MSKGYKKSNEELVRLYQVTGNEEFLQEIITQNIGLLNKWAGMYVNSIPNAEIEDLVSEAYFPLIKAVNDYKEGKGCNFISFLKVYVSQHYNRIYQQETRKKRYTGLTPDSYERLADINKEGSSTMDTSFTVECSDFSTVEFLDMLENLELNEKERVVVNVLMCGGTKGEVAKELHITPASTTWYIKRIKEKFISAGYQYAI